MSAAGSTSLLKSSSLTDDDDDGDGDGDDDDDIYIYIICRKNLFIYMHTFLVGSCRWALTRTGGRSFFTPPKPHLQD